MKTMARGRNTYFICMPLELFESVKTHLGEFPVPIVWSDGQEFSYEFANPSDIPSFILKSVTSVSCHVRVDRVSMEMPARRYFDNMIAEGMVRIEFPRISRRGEYVDICTITVGLDDPKQGICSPLPLYNKLSKIVRKLCPSRVVLGKTKCMASPAAVVQLGLELTLC